MLKIVFLALFALMGGAEAHSALTGEKALPWIKANCLFFKSANPEKITSPDDSGEMSSESFICERKDANLSHADARRTNNDMAKMLDEELSSSSARYQHKKPTNKEICHAMCEHVQLDRLKYEKRSNADYFTESFLVAECEELNEKDDSNHISQDIYFGIALLRAHEAVKKRDDEIRRILEELDDPEFDEDDFDDDDFEFRNIDPDLARSWNTFQNTHHATKGRKLNQLLITEFRRAVASGIIVLDYRKIPDGRDAGEYGFEWGFSQAVGDILNSEISSDWDFLLPMASWLNKYKSLPRAKSALRIVMRGTPQAAGRAAVIRVAAGSAAALGYFFTSAAPSSFDVQIADNPLSYFKFNQSDTVIGYFDEPGKERFRDSMLTLLFLLQTFNAATQ